ncbi:phosphatase inhibitor-domain-containing protein [Cadophora sp. MPI-SDFR-AT-0126]|nr:phosphatase inhibitor-domain-containing protein [Leotiomycetes sp. MPI-SDFR-AT-0126]
MATTSRAPAGQQTHVLQPTPQPSTTTRTQMQTQTQAILRLRGAPLDSERGSSTRRGIQWASDVIDNEGLGRKKSKVCCIYHAPKGIDESSDESSSDSDSESDSGDDGSARPVGGAKKAAGRGKGCGHGHGHGHGKGKGNGDGEGSGSGKARKRSPNAYERMPMVKGAAKEK